MTLVTRRAIRTRVFVMLNFMGNYVRNVTLVPKAYHGANAIYGEHNVMQWLLYTQLQFPFPV